MLHFYIYICTSTCWNTHFDTGFACSKQIWSSVKLQYRLLGSRLSQQVILCEIFCAEQRHLLTAGPLLAALHDEMPRASVRAVEREAAEREAVSPDDCDVGANALDVHGPVWSDLVTARVLPRHLYILKARVLQIHIALSTVA